jgi:hypothetical protein
MDPKHHQGSMNPIESSLGGDQTPWSASAPFPREAIPPLGRGVERVGTVTQKSFLVCRRPGSLVTVLLSVRGMRMGLRPA